MANNAVVHEDELLRTDDVLVGAQLNASPVRGEDPLRIGLNCGRPLLYPVPVADLPAALRHRAAATGGGYLGALFTFDLEPAPAGYRYAAARFTVDLGECGTTAVLLHSAADHLGLLADGPASPLAGRAQEAGPGRLLSRLLWRDDRPRAWTTGVQSSRFGWHYRDRRGAPLLPRTYGVHAVLEPPAGRAELRGAFEAEVDLVGAVRRHASTSRRIGFAVPVPGPGRRGAAAVRLCMAADIVGYSGRTPRQAEDLQDDLVRILAGSREAAGIGASRVDAQPQGDGQFAVLPSGLDESEVIPRLVRGLARELAARNATAGADRLRLRVALHRGLVKEAANGWVGRASTAVHRLLDSPPLRAAVAENPDADYVLGVPDVLYDDVLATGSFPPPGAFREVTVDLPGKAFHERSWIYVPGAMT